MYGLEVIGPQRSALAVMNKPINRAVHKILKVSDNEAGNHVRHFLGIPVHDITVLYKERRKRFLIKTGALAHILYCHDKVLKCAVVISKFNQV